MASPRTVRVIAYIDGFNLYYGMRQSNYRRYYWLDLEKLASNLLKPNQQLLGVKYFTSRITSPEDKRLRQTSLLEAFATLPLVRVFEGQYFRKPAKCEYCAATWETHHEKMT